MGVILGILRRGVAIAAAISLVLLGAARAGESGSDGLVRVLTSGLPYARGFGDSIAAAGDVDGDGTPDLLIGIPGGRDGYGGAALVLSGSDGSILRTLDGPGFPLDDFGAAVASVGDLDGRGTPDFLVGAPGGQSMIPEGSQPTYSMAFAGEDGAVLFDSGPMEIPGFGQSVAVLPDLDGDGVAELSIGSGYYLASVPVALSIYSGASGSLLHVFETPLQYEEGISLVPLDDMDGDGRPELAVGRPGPFEPGRQTPGLISIRSGATFEEIRSIRGRSRNRVFGGEVVPLGPPGEPGTILVAVGTGTRSRSRVILLLDARTGRRLRTIRPSAAGEFFRVMATIGDQDGDGIREIVIRTDADDDRWKFASEGRVQVYAGGTGRLLFSRRGWNIEDFVDGVAPAGDVDGDGREDLAITAGPLAGEREVRIYRVQFDAGAPSVRIAFQRTSALLPAGLEGDLEVGFAGLHQPFHLDIRGLPLTLYHSGDRQVHLEDGTGSGSFVPIGYLSPVDLGDTFPFAYGRWALDDAGTDIPVSILRADLSGLAGRRVRVGSATSPVLEAVVPSPFATDFRGVSLLSRPEGSPPSAIRGRVRVRSSIGSGTTTLDVRAAGSPSLAGATVWSEESTGGGSWTLLGALHRGRLTLDTGHGHPLPGKAQDGASLSGRGIEVRDGETVVLRGTMP